MNIKLTGKDRVEILKLLSEGHSSKSLAARFGVSTQTIKRLKRTLNVPCKNISNVPKELQQPKTVVKTYPCHTTDIPSLPAGNTTNPDDEESLDDYLERLKRYLVHRTLSILENPDKRTADHLKAIDMLAKWSGLYFGGDEKIQREIKRQTEAALESELTLMFDRITDDEELSEEAKDRIFELCSMPPEAS